MLYEQSFSLFLILDVLIGGGAAFLAGRGLAMKWRPFWLPIVYAFPLAAAVRFFNYALFSGTLFSFSYFTVDFLILAAFAFLGYRLKLVSKMVHQYRWKYVFCTPFFWKEK